MTAKKKNHSDLTEELVTELKYMRSTVREAGEGFILRKECEIETLLSCLTGVPPAQLHDAAAPWLREVRNLKVKPAKGRLKDLKKIDSLLEDLRESVIDLQHISDVPPANKARCRPPRNEAAPSEAETAGRSSP